MQNVMVIGGAGFIGSHLVDRLLADGVAVDVVDDLSRGGLANLADARAVGGTLKIHHLDAGSPEFDSLLGMRTPDVLFHLAAIPRGRPAPSDLARAFSTTMAVVEAARAHRVGKIVVAIPASAIHGRPSTREVPVKEGALEPRGVRGVVTCATIDLLTMYRELDSVEFTALALASVYGSRQRADGGVVAAFRAAVDERRAPVMTGDGRQTRDLVFVDDVVDGLVRAGERGSGLVVNIGTGEQTTLRSLWESIAGPNGTEPEFVPSPPDEIVRFAVSPVRARIHLAWSSWTSVSDGLKQLR